MVGYIGGRFAYLLTEDGEIYEPKYWICIDINNARVIKEIKDNKLIWGKKKIKK